MGLTGGVGMGKSFLAAEFARRGHPVIDSDDIARRVVREDAMALGEIRDAFGSGVFGSQGRLDRRALAERVFSSKEEMRRLEAILHPRIRRRWREWVREKSGTGRGPALVVIPLLYEVEAQGEFSLVLCAACGTEEQRGRLLARGWSRRHAAERIAAQMDIGEKMARADRVLWTGCSREMALEQAARLSAELSEEEGRPS